MTLVIDNYDSFTFNLVQAIGSLGEEVRVVRNDETDCDTIERLNPDRLLISPGPGHPREAGLSTEVVRRFLSARPILGVCLGHQCIAAALYAEVVPSGSPMHGKSSEIHHDGRGLYHRLENPFVAGRYHSLVVRRDSLPSELQVSATSEDGHIMGLRHRKYPVEGVQFHPESILTQSGRALLKNFLKARRT